MDLEESTVKSVWNDIEMSSEKETVDISELYMTKIYPNLISSNQLICKVKFPEYVLQGWFGYKSFYNYEVRSTFDMSEFKVYRRYKDIEALHQSLTSEYPGFNLPPIPSKTLMKCNDVNELHKRRGHFEFYLNYIAMHFMLKNSKIFSQFLTEEVFRKKTSNSEEYLVSLTDQYEQKMAVILVGIDVALGKRNIAISEKFAKRFVKLKRSEESLEFLSSSFGDWSQNLDREINVFDSIRHLEFCDWSFDLVKLNMEYMNTLESSTLEINKELLRTKGLLSSIQCLRHYKMQVLYLEKMIERKRSKLQHTNTCKLEILQNYALKFQTKVAEIEKNIQEEYQIYKKSHKEAIHKVLNNTAKNSQFFLGKSSAFLLNTKHNIN